MSSRPTLQDVANHAGVHLSTASRALDPLHARRISESTLARVRAAAAELGYDGGATLGARRRRTRSVGVIVPSFENPYAGSLIRGLSVVLERHGLMPLVGESQEAADRHADLLEHFITRRVDAIATTAAHLTEVAVLAQAAERVPLVLGVRNVPGSGVAAVFHDDERGAAIATEHLLRLGHRDIAQLAGAQDIDSFRQRAAGFRRAVDANGARDASPPQTGPDPSFEGGRELMLRALDQPQRPTAVFAHTDIMAVGALAALEEAGLRCPDDISIVGYNNVLLSAQLSPPLTTVSVPSELLGRRLGELLVARIDDPDLPPEETRLSATLVERASTRALHPRPAPPT
jgi:LacI family transcriptional regulator